MQLSVSWCLQGGRVGGVSFRSHVREAEFHNEEEVDDRWSDEIPRGEGSLGGQRGDLVSVCVFSAHSVCMLSVLGVCLVCA